MSLGQEGAREGSHQALGQHEVIPRKLQLAERSGQYKRARSVAKCHGRKTRAYSYQPIVCHSTSFRLSMAISIGSFHLSSFSMLGVKSAA